MISWLKRQLCRVRLPCKHFFFRRPVASFVLLVLLLLLLQVLLPGVHLLILDLLGLYLLILYLAGLYLLLLQVLAMNSWDTTPTHIRYCPTWPRSSNILIQL